MKTNRTMHPLNFWGTKAYKRSTAEWSWYLNWLINETVKREWKKTCGEFEDNFWNGPPESMDKKPDVFIRYTQKMDENSWKTKWKVDPPKCVGRFLFKDGKTIVLSAGHRPVSEVKERAQA